MKKLTLHYLLILLLMQFMMPVYAQIGNGWKAYSPTKKVHLDDEAGLQIFNYTTYKSVCTPICADYSYDSSTDAETFRILTTKSNRSEIRLQNDYSSGSRQFEGYVTFYAPLNDESLMQIFGSTEGATQMMIRGYAADGGSMRGAGKTLATNIYGVEVKVNMIHMQEDKGNKIQIYINDTLKTEIPDNEAVSNYHKYGNYGTMRTGEAVVKWRRVRSFRDGVPPGDTLPPVNTNSFDITDNGGIITAQFTNTSKPSENFPSLIDNNLATKYYQSGKKALWVRYESKAPAMVVRYTLTSGNDVPERDPKNWSLLASNNGADWVILDTRANETFSGRGLKRTFAINNNTTPYIYYRLDITANNGHTGTQFAEWELFQRKEQVVSLDSIANKTYGDESFELTASANSGLPVLLEVVEGPAIVNDNILTITGAGSVLVRASQAGNENYFPGSMERRFLVQKAAQSITADSLLPANRSETVILYALASSGLPVSYSILSGPGVINANTLSFTGEGQITIRIAQPGNENYEAAPPIDRTILVFGDDQKKDGIRLIVAPNPTTGHFKVKLDNKKDVQYTFTIFDKFGNLVTSSVIPKSHKMFEVNFDLIYSPAGLYYLHVTDGVNVYVRTILKQ